MAPGRSFSPEEDMALCSAFARGGQEAVGRAAKASFGRSPQTCWRRFLYLYLSDKRHAQAAVYSRNAKLPESERMNPFKAEQMVQEMYGGAAAAPLLVRIAKERGQLSGKERQLLRISPRKRKRGKAKRARSPQRATRAASEAAAPSTPGADPPTGLKKVRMAHSPPPSPHMSSPQASPSMGSAHDGDRNAYGETVCRICKSNLDETDIILCDGVCGHEYHRRCLRVPLAMVPAGRWFCEECRLLKHFGGGAGMAKKAPPGAGAA